MTRKTEKTICTLKGKHEIYCCGARVQISAKGVKVLSEPTVDYCPLHAAMYGTKKIDREAVKKSVEMKIAGHGFCCANRSFDAEPIVAYGASEMMRVWLEKRLIDCAVVVCEGAGTVITSNGALVQAIGARLTGIIKTSAIPETIRRIEADGGTILDKDGARIDQVEGVKRAFDLGHKRIAVSVAGFQAKAISEIRDFETSAKADVLIFSVCNTYVRKADVNHIAKADIACASASKILRNEIGNKALLQLGVTIPVYALTEKGKRLVLAYLAEFKNKLVVFRTSKLPYRAENRGPKLKTEQSSKTNP
jgi:putative methanogenesis marker protein 8